MVNTASRVAAVALLLFAVAPAQVKERQCGFDRWAVKVLDDRDASRVDFNPADTTVAKLVAVRIHEIPYPDDRRIEPEELRVYRVKARLLAVKRESDQDLHLIIEEPERKGVTMIVEIPAPRCAPANYSQRFTKARAFVEKLPMGSIIIVTGVGFWDYIHNARGAARNGFELHPVLKIEPPQSAENLTL